MKLPPRRKPPKSGIARGPKREWKWHEKWVRGFGCSVPLCTTGAKIIFAHYRTAANSGTGIRPHSAWGISLCDQHHQEQHRIGQPAFERKYQIDMRAIAREFVRKSPDREMRESLAMLRPEEVP